jgi:hypothetical protein
MSALLSAYVLSSATAINIHQLRRLVTGLSPQRPGFDPQPTLVDKVQGDMFISKQFGIFLVIPPMFHIALYQKGQRAELA